MRLIQYKFLKIIWTSTFSMLYYIAWEQNSIKSVVTCCFVAFYIYHRNILTCVRPSCDALTLICLLITPHGVKQHLRRKNSDDVIPDFFQSFVVDIFYLYLEKVIFVAINVYSYKFNIHLRHLMIWQ